MAESKHDDLADALARLAGGDVAPSEREHEPAPPPPPPPPPVPPTPPAAKPTFRPTAPAPRAPAAPPSMPKSPPKVPAPARAPAPSPAPPVVARPQRPAAPTARPLAPLHPNLTPPHESVPTDDEQAEMDDDDAVIVPAPDASVFIPKRKPTTTAEARARVARQKQIDFRRTIIPVLLTTGALTVAFGLAPPYLGPDSIAAALPRWITPTLLATGAVLLGLAGVNMASVHAMLAADARTAAGRVPASR